MNADLVRLFQLREPAVKRHAGLAKVASASEGENQRLFMCLPVVRVQARELVASFDLVRPQTRRSEPILEKNRPDHHGQYDHDYIGCYLDFIFHHCCLRALGKAELCLNSAALADTGRAAEQNYLGAGTPDLRLRLASRARTRSCNSLGVKFAGVAAAFVVGIGAALFWTVAASTRL